MTLEIQGPSDTQSREASTPEASPDQAASLNLDLALADTIQSRAWTTRRTNWGAVMTTLLDHPEGAHKDGPSYVPGLLAGAERKKGAVSGLYMLVLDLDSGDDLDEIASRCAALGLEAVVHSTYSHLSRQTKIRFDDFKRHSGTGEATETAVRDYLVAKKHMRPEVLGTVRVAEKMQQTSDGIFVRVEHAPIQKGRVVMPLASPFVIVDVMTEHDISQRDAQALWGRYLQAVANMLGVKLDESCKDVSRAFYWARHPAGQDHYAKHVEGQALDLSTIKVDSDPATSRTGKAGPVIGAGATAIGNTSFSFPVSQELQTFAKKYGRYFRLADALGEEASDRVRGTTSSVTGLVVECPFDEFHSNAGDSSDKACFVMSASDTEHGNFVWACQHASCKERDRLEFLAKALADEWLSAAILYEPDYIDAPPDPCVVGRTSAADLTSESPLENVERVLRLAAECDDLLVRAAMLKLVKANAKMGIGECREIVKDYEREAKASQRRAGGKPHFTWLTDRFDDIVEQAAALLVADNARDPHLFRMSSAVVRLGEDEATNAILTEPVGKQILRQELNRLATWGRMDAENEKSISCPGDIAEHLINDPELGLPPLTSIVDAPFFDREGRLILEAGYHAPSFTYHHPRSGLAFDPVSPAPSAAEIERARELLLVDVDGDFPFSDGTPGSRSSRAHAVALKLEMFVRQMIQGQTPIYLIQKPSPGTGATLFVNAAAEIGFGSPAVPQAEVHSPEEFRKNLTATLMTGTSLYWLDNVHKRIDSSSLALATTTEVWRDRILGVSKTVVLPVRCSWIISGNNVELSEELARRAVLIRFDANLERPTERQDFRHPDLIGHIRRNRGALVWASLTLVQAWIAAGKPAGEARLASYEAWSRVMGGILAIAGIDGVLENRDELKEATADDDAPMKAFVRLWHGEFGHARVPTSAPESDGGSGLTSLRSLLDLYQLHAHEIDLGFNSIRREAWPSLLGRTINKYRNRVFEIAETSGAIIRVKLRAERTSGGAVKWLERISP